MLLVLWMIIFFAIYGVACVQLPHSNLGDPEDIFVAHVIIIIKFPIVAVFFCCVAEVVVPLYSVICFICL